MTFREFEGIAGISAIIAIAIGVWYRVKIVFHWLFSQVVVEQRCNWRLGTVAFEHFDIGTRWFWNKRRLIWYAKSVARDGEEVVESNDGASFELKFFYIRGLVQWEKLINDAVKWDDTVERNSADSRFTVIKMFGVPRYPSSEDEDEDGDAPQRRGRRTGGSVAIADESAFSGKNRHIKRPLHWRIEDIGSPIGLSSLDRLSLSSDLLDVVDETKFWKRSEGWYRDRGIPWKRSFGYEGLPGSGKTSLSRGIAEELGIPLALVDLASMTNAELASTWSACMNMAPCMILLEDIDSVFKGRTNIAKNSVLTFDALLNCIDGVEQADGIILIMTTNNINDLDQALKRPGRMDRIVRFMPLDQQGRTKLAYKILDDDILAMKLAQENPECSAAEFQEICFQVAIGRQYSKRVHDEAA